MLLKNSRGRRNQICSTGVVPLELAVARLAACCVHPTAAWDRLPASGRFLVAAAYLAASYAAVLIVLLLVH